MFTLDQVKYLLNLPKHICENNDIIEVKRFDPLPFNEKIYMLSKEDRDYLFFLDIFRSSKNQLKLNFHYQEKESAIGLLRIDFGSGHKNPETSSDNVPEILRPYTAQYIDEPHIHYYVEGYKNLAWALPLKDDKFPIKDYSKEQDFCDIILSVAKLINLKTELFLQEDLNYGD